MGVHVTLEIDPQGIDAAAWAAVHDETLALLEAWEPRLLGWGVRQVEGARVAVYQRTLRHDADHPKKARWCVVGDRESLRTAECQSLHRDLGHYLDRRRRDARGDDDIVVAAAAPENEYVHGPAQVFGDKTQGEPYHYAVLAAAMLVEGRFPRQAMVGGDIDRGQAEEARRLAAPILGRDLPLPVRVDAPRLVERLRARYQGEVLAAAFERAFLDDGEERHEAMLRAFPGEVGRAHWLGNLAHYQNPRSLGALGLFIAWLNAGRDLGELCRCACLAPEGPRFQPEELVDTLASTWVAIPRPLREPLDVFRKPSGASHTVASLLGSFFLDMEAKGRHLRIHIEPATLSLALAAVFGEQGPALAAQLMEESAKIEVGLRDRANDIKGFVEQAGEEADDDTEALATIPSVEDMGPNQRMGVRVVAYHAQQILASLRREDARAMTVLGNLKDAKRALARMLSERSPTLTEEAWDAIVAEQDPEVVAWWIALACMEASEVHVSQIRRAFFENAELGRHARRIGRDERDMHEIGQMIAKARADRPRA